MSWVDGYCVGIVDERVASLSNVKLDVEMNVSEIVWGELINGSGFGGVLVSHETAV